MSDPDTPTVVKYHTAGRRQPMLIGKDASGRRLPGGPYTVYQILSLAAVATGLWTTRGLWAAQMTDLSTLLTIAAAATGAGFLAGRVDFSGRNPLWILLSLLASAPLLASSRPGRLGGRPLPPGGLRRVRSYAATLTVRPTAADVTPTGPAAPPPAPTGTEPLPPAISAPPAPVSVQPGGGPGRRMTSLETFLAAAGNPGS